MVGPPMLGVARRSAPERADEPTGQTVGAFSGATGSRLKRTACDTRPNGGYERVGLHGSQRDALHGPALGLADDQQHMRLSDPKRRAKEHGPRRWFGLRR